MSTFATPSVEMGEMLRPGLVDMVNVEDVENNEKRCYELEKNIVCREKIGELFDVKTVDGCIVLVEIIEFKVDYASSTLCNGRKSERKVVA